MQKSNHTPLKIQSTLKFCSYFHIITPNDINSTNIFAHANKLNFKCYVILKNGIFNKIFYVLGINLVDFFGKVDQLLHYSASEISSKILSTKNSADNLFNYSQINYQLNIKLTVGTNELIT